MQNKKKVCILYGENVVIYMSMTPKNTSYYFNWPITDINKIKALIDSHQCIDQPNDFIDFTKVRNEK